MNKLTKHISAILLATLFAFPIVYQSVHISVFHNHKKQCNIHVNSKSDTAQLQQAEDDCAVCDYTFSITDFPEIEVFHCLEFSSHQIFIQGEYTYSHTVISQKSSRAPPLA